MRLGKVVAVGGESCWCCGAAWVRPRTTGMTSPKCECMKSDLCSTCKRCVEHCSHGGAQ